MFCWRSCKLLLALLSLQTECLMKFPLHLRSSCPACFNILSSASYYETFKTGSLFFSPFSFLVKSVLLLYKLVGHWCCLCRLTYYELINKVLRLRHVLKCILTCLFLRKNIPKGIKLYATQITLIYNFRPTNHALLTSSLGNLNLM